MNDTAYGMQCVSLGNPVKPLSSFVNDRQSVRLGIKPPGARHQILLFMSELCGNYVLKALI